jgi:hypothetical protein
MMDDFILTQSLEGHRESTSQANMKQPHYCIWRYINVNVTTNIAKW